MGAEDDFKKSLSLVKEWRVRHYIISEYRICSEQMCEKKKTKEKKRERKKNRNQERVFSIACKGWTFHEGCSN